MGGDASVAVTQFSASCLYALEILSHLFLLTHANFMVQIKPRSNAPAVFRTANPGSVTEMTKNFHKSYSLMFRHREVTCKQNAIRKKR